MTPPARPPGPPSGTTSQDGLQLPPRPSKDGRSPSAASFVTVKSFGRTAPPPPGSFTTELKSTISRPELPGRYEHGSSYAGYDDGNTGLQSSEQRQAHYRDRIEKETKIRIGTENLLEALNAKKEKHIREQRRVVETELNTSNRKIAQLKGELEAEISRNRQQQQDGVLSRSPKGRLSQLFRAAPIRSASTQTPFQQDHEGDSPLNAEAESPSYILAEILQALEAADLGSDYYVNHANELVELFKRHPTLKYDLAWSIFGLRMQILLLSDSREVVAAGYRVLRYAITDRKSLQTIRALQTDYLVVLSLVKESKARVEREQALKFVRAFLDVKDGTREIHPAVARILVAVAEHSDDQLRAIAILTLAELLVKDAELVVEAGAVSILAEAMGSGVYSAPETLLAPFMHLMDLPARRSILKSGFEFSAAYASFTEPHITQGQEDKLKASARVIAGMFKSWPGLMTLSLHNFMPVRSVVASLYVDMALVRNATLDLIADILRIQFPSWAGSFIGGRRLTTYGRVTNMKASASQQVRARAENDPQKRDLVRHFTAVALTILLRQGLLKALMHAEAESPTVQLRKKTSLLLAEVLKMASELLPPSWSEQLQILPGLLTTALTSDNDGRVQATSTVYEVDRVNRTMYRLTSIQPSQVQTKDDGSAARARATSKSTVEAAMDEAQFRQKMIETGVLNTVNYNKWNWPLIQTLIEGPMQNPRRLDEAARVTKFVHRLLGFLRPFKFRFSDAPNTKVNQRYVRAGSALMRTLLQTSEGAKYLADNKLVPQIAECLAQKDPMSGITSTAPLFSPERLAETLVGGYFAFLGVLCSDSKGLQILERWRIINMFYHIVELKNRDELIMTLLTNLDYTLDSHPRIIVAKAMIAGGKSMRIAASKILRTYAMMRIEPTIIGGGAAEWAIKLLVGQLYDPEIEVCEVAIKILEEACNDTTSLEYVVKCRPALDHLGEIGAPLLLRFLSTSVGYHYLDGLDYITKEMDDWFLGRNDSYVTLVEASLARALADIPEKPRSSLSDAAEPQNYGYVPPHFYRELTRTVEGCELLRGKSHFEEFAATIQDFCTESSDPEIILKVKGCLWAVGNVGSMELGAPFLEETDVTKWIVSIAETSEVMTLRGTAFFVLGLIGRSLHGQEILAQEGWDGNCNAGGESLGYSLPLEFDRLFSLRLFHAQAAVPPPMRRPLALDTAATSSDPMDAEILASITKLGNTVLMNKAVAELNALKHKKKASGFSSPALFRRALAVLAGHRFGVQQWRFVIDLFEKGVLRKIVLEEEDSGDDRNPCYRNVRDEAQSPVPVTTPHLEQPISFEPAVYKYRPLQAAHFRLVNILPGRPHDPICVEIEHVELATAPPYCALSYVWGVPEPRCHVWVGDQTLEVGPNLHAALIQIRSKSAALTIWIDAIAINQSDNPEKSKQIPLMATLFRKAERVIAWLGEDDGAAEMAFRVFSRWAEFPLPGNRTTANEVRKYISDEQSVERDALRSFYCRTYFRRAWIVQETCTDRDRSPVLLWGTFLVPLSDVSKAMEVLYMELSGEIIDNFLEDGRIGYENLAAVSGIALGAVTFSDMYDCMLNREASNVLDRIYAARGLFCAAGDSYPAPDYDAPLHEVCTSYTRAAIRIEQRLTVLGPDRPRCRSHGLPSWAVDLNDRPGYDRVNGDFWRREHRAAGDSLVDWLDEAGDYELCLPLKGILVDSIVECYDSDIRTICRAFKPECNWWATVRHEMTSLYGRIAASHTLSRRDEAGVAGIVACVTCDTFAPSSSLRTEREYSDTSPAWYDANQFYAHGRIPLNDEELFTRSAAFIETYDSILTCKKPPDDALGTWYDSETAKLFAEHVESTLRDRRVAVTKSGVLSLVSCRAEPGDEICLLLGGKNPFVLRRTDGAEILHTLVSDAYMHGIMFGRLYDRPGNIVTEYRLV
ncbi:hypothetical protein B0A48_06616 [Cryoendolithus antarcticus]|uniref:REM-1 domain-containing protein n=1 Tax=Cryoendolithus antarcticus TaxID=1507870 RepID=A0A1V8T8V5_9PEZI|nr:hypothetical protein B0A48_06616 [Cryoendolithus antarcticus]